MTNIVVLVKDRPRLTEQCLRTLYANTAFDSFNVVIVDDGSRHETREILMRYAIRKNCEVVTFLKGVGIVGFSRNVGAWASERFFGRGDFLCFLDNDVAVFQGWLDSLTSKLAFWEDSLAMKIAGGCRHPFHHPNDFACWGRNGLYQVEFTDAVAGYSMLMRWGTFDYYGPFDQHAKGTGQSEDFALCQRITSVGGKVGYIHPPVLAHCGITNSDGRPATGAESFERVPGLIYE